MRMMVVMMGMAMLAACSGAPEAPPPADPVALAKASAAQILASAPKSLGGGVRITGAAAEGRTLTIALDGMDDWRGQYSDASMATTMKRGICFEPGVEALTKAKGLVRLQSRDAKGVALPPLLIDAC
ncbi:hypothetical protein [Sphingomonas abaci]|uniref:Lipoprotein n=1 Tax=Sphingomonas abaci TaxID=237611 RepID=A0A7W7AKX2_9SPHN|nr:hypothetical protein [Sphingomonas abaci]MBB4618937.1 hypothetical protein [Sphingomonas abaci]